MTVDYQSLRVGVEDVEQARAVLAKERSQNSETFDAILDGFTESGEEFDRVAVKALGEGWTPGKLAQGLNARAAKRELPVQAKSFGDKETVLLARVETAPEPRQRKPRKSEQAESE